MRFPCDRPLRLLVRTSFGVVCWSEAHHVRQASQMQSCHHRNRRRATANESPKACCYNDVTVKASLKATRRRSTGAQVPELLPTSSLFVYLRPKKMDAQLTRAQENETFIAVAYREPTIWDQRRAEYKTLDVRTARWKRIVRGMGMEGTKGTSTISVHIAAPTTSVKPPKYIYYIPWLHYYVVTWYCVVQVRRRCY